jgi:uncharacterized damage-inducible protein DinB
MNKEIQFIIRSLQQANNGEPWFGRPVYAILEEVDISKVYIKPNNTEHSLIELLYHMLTWAEFTLKRIEKDPIQNMAAFEKMNWREIDPAVHNWKKGLAEFKSVNEKIIQLLDKKDDEFLKEIVDYRKYNFRFLLNGYIQHDIYHLGQMAYLKKLLA